MVEVYKHLHSYNKASTCQKLTHRTRPQRQHKQELQRNFANDGVRGYQTNSFYYRSIDPWNALGANVVETKTVASFKEELLSEWKDELHKL